MAAKLKYVDYLTGGCTDGIIAYGSCHDDEELFRYAAEKSANCVLIESNLSDCTADRILLDNFHGAYAATEHLIRQGRKHIIHVTCDMNYDVGLERLNGFVQAMHDYRMPLGPDSILYADHFEDIACQQMKKKTVRRYPARRLLCRRGQARLRRSARRHGSRTVRSCRSGRHRL